MLRKTIKSINKIKVLQENNYIVKFENRMKNHINIGFIIKFRL